MSTATQTGLTILLVMTALGCGCAIELGYDKVKEKYIQRKAKNEK